MPMSFFTPTPFRLPSFDAHIFIIDAHADVIFICLSASAAATSHDYEERAMSAARGVADAAGGAGVMRRGRDAREKRKRSRATRDFDVIIC